MKISLCLPVFDRAEMLANALESVLLQTHPDYEVVIKDGCIRRPAITNPFLRDQFRRLGSRLNYVLGEDKGIFPALNQALEHSKGELLYFMCSDDALGNPDTLAAVNKEFEGRKTPYWCYGQTQNMDVWGDDLDVCGLHTTLDEMLVHNRIGQPSVFWNRRMFDLVGYFNYSHAGDYDYWLRCWRKREPKYMPRVLGKFRKWPNQSTAQHIEEVQAEADFISEKHNEEIAIERKKEKEANDVGTA